MFATHSSFIAEFQQSSFCISFPNTIPSMYTFKTFSTFPPMSIEIPQRDDDFIRTSQILLACHFIMETHFLCVWSSTLCGPYAHISQITSLLKVSAIAITLLLFFYLSQRFQIFPLSPKFHPLQILHHFLTTIVYTLIPKCPQNELLSLSILLPACSTHQLFSFSALHTLLFSFHKDFPRLKYQILSYDIQVKTWRFFTSSAHLRAVLDWGPFYFFLSWGLLGAKFFYREHALAYPQLQFSDMSGPTKQLS